MMPITGSLFVCLFVLNLFLKVFCLDSKLSGHLMYVVQSYCGRSEMLKCYLK